MNHLRFPRTAFFSAIGLMLVLPDAPIRAQPQPASPPGQPAHVSAQDLPSLLTQNGKAAQPGLAAVHASAMAFAKAGAAAAAEKALTAQSKFTPNSANWHMETSQRLVSVAGEIARAGSPAAVPALAASALQHLDQVATLAKDNHAKAKAKAAAGFIHERFMGDPVAAIASYQAALALDPTDPAIKETLARLQMADANLRTKIHPPKP